MLRIAKWATPLMALGLVLAYSTFTKADDAKTATGSVSGTVTDKDDKPVSGATVRLVVPGHGHKAAANQADDATPDKNKGSDNTGGDTSKPSTGAGGHPAPVATATTDNDGKFEMKDVPVGSYAIRANMKGVGMAMDKVEVKEGETAKVDLKLKPRGS